MSRIQEAGRKLLPFKRARVVGHEFSFEYDENIHPVADLTGLTGEDECIILVSPGLSDDVERDTVLHEALHALWGQTELNNRYDDEKDEEPIINTISPLLLEMLRLNPRLRRYLWPD